MKKEKKVCTNILLFVRLLLFRCIPYVLPWPYSNYNQQWTKSAISFRSVYLERRAPNPIISLPSSIQQRSIELFKRSWKFADYKTIALNASLWMEKMHCSLKLRRMSTIRPIIQHTMIFFNHRRFLQIGCSFVKNTNVSPLQPDIYSLPLPLFISLCRYTFCLKLSWTETMKKIAHIQNKWIAKKWKAIWVCCTMRTKETVARTANFTIIRNCDTQTAFITTCWKVFLFCSVADTVHYYFICVLFHLIWFLLLLSKECINYKRATICLLH